MYAWYTRKIWRHGIQHENQDYNYGIIHLTHACPIVLRHWKLSRGRVHWNMEFLNDAYCYGV
jgi:hypothetical protein